VTRTGEKVRPSPAELLLLPLLCALFAARHVWRFHDGVHLFHLLNLVEGLKALDAGHWLMPGASVGDFSLRLGGPLYHALHLPARLWESAPLGLHITYAAYELAGLLFWVAWGRLRGGRAPAAVWGGAFFLAWQWSANTGLAENTVLASFLAAPLFMAAAVAMARPPRGWLLVGVLLGLLIQVHVSGLLFGVVLVIAALSRRPRARRAAWLFVGTMVATVPMQLSLDPRGMAPFLDHWDRAGGLARLGNMNPAAALQSWEPLALGALVLMVGLALRRRRVGGEALLAVLWAVGGAMLLVLALSWVRQEGALPYRFALLGPAKAMLVGLALAWSLDVAASLAARLGFAHLRPLILVGLAGLSLALVMGHRAMKASGDSQSQRQTTRSATQAGKQGCSCTLNRMNMTCRLMPMLADARRVMPVNRLARAPLDGPLARDLGLFYFFGDTAPLVRPPPSGERGITLATPPVVVQGGGPSAGATRSSGVWFWEGSEALAPEWDDGAGAYKFKVKAAAGGQDIWLLAGLTWPLSGEPGAQPRAVQAWLEREGGAAAVARPVWRCSCDEGMGGGWLLFRLSSGEAGPGQLLLRSRTARRQNGRVKLFRLPTAP